MASDLYRSMDPIFVKLLTSSHLFPREARTAGSSPSCCRRAFSGGMGGEAPPARDFVATVHAFSSVFRSTTTALSFRNATRQRHLTRRVGQIPTEKPSEVLRQNQTPANTSGTGMVLGLHTAAERSTRGQNGRRLDVENARRLSRRGELEVLTGDFKEGVRNGQKSLGAAIYQR